MISNKLKGRIEAMCSDLALETIGTIKEHLDDGDEEPTIGELGETMKQVLNMIIDMWEEQ